jgi:hypothetical protein
MWTNESTPTRFSVCTHKNTGLSRWKTAQLRDSWDDEEETLATISKIKKTIS